MATIPPDGSGWTIETYAAHNEALREAEKALQDERDRRYAEVSLEREKALAIKEKADEAARILVAENQAYRDEKGNELREQINRERLLYATKDELQNVTEKLEVLIGTRAQGVGLSASTLQAVVLVAIAAIGLYLALHK